MYPEALQKLASAFRRLPGIGSRVALRFALHVMKADEQEVSELISAIQKVRSEISLCSFCFAPFEGEGLCDICSDNTRIPSLLCIVEKEGDLEAIEKTKKYRGLYFILGGSVESLKKEEIEKLRVSDLVSRLKDPAAFGIQGRVEEVILATNPTLEGESTALYVERKIQPLKLKTTRLGRGLPIGGELEYADEETLSLALEGRR
ncbi:MAG: recombination mediator RecR [bacterium]|nr:recombination mediator RecR [bacterium]